MSPDATGVVVAGGHSTRFGDREKALAELDGGAEPLHAAYRVGPTATAAAAALSDDQQSPGRCSTGCQSGTSTPNRARCHRGR